MPKSIYKNKFLYILVEIKNQWLWDFPCGPVAKTLCSRCRGPGIHPWLGMVRELDPTYVALSCLSRVWLFVTVCTVAHQVHLSLRFFKQDYWTGVPCPPQEDIQDPGIEPTSLCLLDWQVDSLPLASPGKPHIPQLNIPHAEEPTCCS